MLVVHKKSETTIVVSLFDALTRLSLGFLCGGSLVGGFVHELEQLGAAVVRGERIARLLSGLGLANHLDLADICIRNVDV